MILPGWQCVRCPRKVTSMCDKVVCSNGKLQWEDRDEKSPGWWPLVTEKMRNGEKDEWWQKCLKWWKASLWRKMRSYLSGDQALPPIMEHTDLRAAGGGKYFLQQISQILIFVWWSLICPFWETGLPTCNFCMQSNFLSVNTKIKVSEIVFSFFLANQSIVF